MKNTCHYIITAFALTGSLCSCEKVATPYLDTVAANERALVYIARFNGNSQNLVTFPQVDSARTVRFGAAFGALGVPGSGIPVTYKIDDAAFDSVNNVRIKSGVVPYQKFPDGSYTISSLNATIQAGETNSDLTTVSYLSKNFNPDVDYLLPISIATAGNYTIGSNKTFFLVAPKLQAVAASKSGWTITANSEELTGEGSANGKAIFAIDDNVNTYWHSQWQAASPPFPHTLTIDMKNEVYVTRIELAARQNSTTGFTRFNIEVSKDGNAWTNLGTDLIFDPAIKTFQGYPLEPGYRRFVRLTALKTQNTTMTSTHLAEITVYRY